MYEYYEKTKEEIGKYFARSNIYTVIGKVQEQACRFIAKRITEEMTYFVEIREIDVGRKIVLKVYPMIHCPEAYRDMLRSYLYKYNADMEEGEMDIDGSGAVFYVASKSYADRVITEQDIYHMERTAYHHITYRRDELERVAHGLFPRHFTIYEEGDKQEGFLADLAETYMLEKTKQELEEVKAKIAKEKAEKEEVINSDKDKEEIMTFDQFEDLISIEEEQID